ncbi:MAG TPA: cytochrome c [Thermoanaerobaculia bacterium]|nr:cytochrome c [Thermoanaerobaculia bacterium]
MKHRRDAVATAFVFCLLMLGCRHTQVALPRFSDARSNDTASSAARGEYVVRSVSVCGGCHAADPKRDVDGPLSGGKEFRNWRIGISRAANLTSDPTTGLGSWNEAEIVRALRNGQSRNGRLLTPVMPYEWFHEMSDDDALAVARYLKSLPPVRNEVRQSPNLIFKMGKLFLGHKPAISASAPPRAATAEYGGYLAQHVGLCADCHTQLGGLLQKPDMRRLFAGMTHPPKDFPVKPSNLTPDPSTGIGRWSEADFVRTIRTGVNPSGRTLHPFMPSAELRRMTDDDLLAIYHHLQTIPPVRNSIR